MPSLFETAYNPDVLSCIANLSSDEVFTPPEVANQMLDLLPGDIWQDENATFLDPACKSGVFLREIAKRLIEGQLPDYQAEADEINRKKKGGEVLTNGDRLFLGRLDEVVRHVFKEQVFGIATTELCSLLSRRSVYCSKYPTSKWSVVKFGDDEPEGNIRYKRHEHNWRGGRCKYCGASRQEYERDETLESYAYEFIHLEDPKEALPMKFDVIVGNPPYQLSDGGGNGSSATPIYHQFIQQAQLLNPRFLLMIVPARWHQGGKGLDAFRGQMLSSGKVSYMKTYNDSRHCFQGVDIAGGVCYFKWERDYNGECVNSYVDRSGSETTEVRQLDELPVFIADNMAIKIIHTVKSKANDFYSNVVYSRNPFGIGRGEPNKHGSIILRYRGGLTTCEPKDITSNNNLVGKWKVIVSKASAEHAGQADGNGQRKIIGVIEMLPPSSVCSETYLLIDTFESEMQAKRVQDYLKTRFARYLIWQATPTQNISKNCFMFLPKLPDGLPISDRSLFDYFGLEPEQIDAITSNIKSLDEKLNGVA